MSESFIKNLRIACLVIMVAGMLMGNGLALSIAYMGFILSMAVPYFRFERIYWALMRSPEMKEKLETLMREDFESRLGVNKDKDKDTGRFKPDDDIIEFTGSKKDDKEEGSDKDSKKE